MTENGVATAGEETAEAAADAGGATASARGAYLGGHFGAVAGAAGAGDDVQGHCLRRAVDHLSVGVRQKPPVWAGVGRLGRRGADARVQAGV